MPGEQGTLLQLPLTIVPAGAEHEDAIWAALEPVLRAAEVYALPRAWSRAEALAYWTSPGHEVVVALAGSVAVTRQARALLREHAVPVRRSLLLVGSWLSMSLRVGGQLAFWLRPFFGIASLPSGGRFALGDEPTSTGARNFYEELVFAANRLFHLMLSFEPFS